MNKIIFYFLFLFMTIFSVNIYAEDYDQFVNNFVNDLKENNVLIKNYFTDDVYIEGYGETIYKENIKNDYGGFSFKEGYLYGSLFVNEKMEQYFGYKDDCFSKAFKENLLIKGKKKNPAYFWVIKGKIRYGFEAVNKSNNFKIVRLKIEEN